MRYWSKKVRERDDEIIGEGTPRYFVGNYLRKSVVDDDIKVFAVMGDFDGLKNVTAYGLFSTEHGIFVEPTLNLKFRQGSVSDYTFIEDAGTLSIAFIGKYEKNPNYIPGIDDSRIYYTGDKIIDNIDYQEVSAVLDRAIAMSNADEITPLTAEQMYDMVSYIREYGLEQFEDAPRVGKRR